MPTYDEWEKFVESVNTQKSEARRFQHQAQVEVGRRAKMAVEHPGWQVFVDHCQVALESLDARIQHLTTALADSEDLGEGLTKLKLQLRDLKGERRGIEHALALIPQLVEAGAAAGQALEPRA